MFHEITLIGTVGREPELRYTADGKACCSMSVASNRPTGNGMKETHWFKVTTWEKTAENVSNMVHKGMKVFVIGRLIADKETGSPRLFQKQDGTYAASFEVSAREFRIVDFGNGQAQGQPVQAQQQYQPRPQVQQQTQQRPAQPQASQQRQAPQAQYAQSGYQEDIPW